MSTTFGHGKTSMLKKLKISELSAAVEQIGKTGMRLFVITYGGKQDDSLYSLKYTKFIFHGNGIIK